MKKYLIKFSAMAVVATAMLFSSCQDQLDVINPNQPTTDVLEQEAALSRLALGVYNGGIDIEYLWLAQGYHEVMGDAIYIPWGNFSWRWANQATSITLDDGTVVTPPQGGTQAQELNARNLRAFGNDNAYYNEWYAMYQVNNTANLILTQVETVELSGDADTKKATYKAWAHWWKGFAYSRLGSMYSAGLILDEFGQTTSDFVSNTDLLAEADRQFDLAIAELNSLSAGGAYEEVLLQSIPDFTLEVGVPTPAAWIRNINTMKARNILVNTKRDEMSNAQWNEIASLASNGIQQGDFVFLMKQDDIFLATGWVNPRMLMGWHFLSERLVQDYPEGDQRRDRNVSEYSTPQVNRAGRGLLYGTRWSFVDIANGGDIVSLTPGLAKHYIGGSYEENVLIQAEASLFTGDLAGAANGINTVRQFQNAGLDPISGADQATLIEELRKERRVGLLMRGLAFYDARRWGVTEPVEQGGGRIGIVLSGSPGNPVVNENAVINYNYLDYWGVPAQELEFNVPSEGSADTNPR